uniref:Fungal lipase-like domain-containing protein n=1 Tax=Globodera rostochiensis TaxID=31243 RepID=A0A914HKQ9_GLORO
MWCVLGRVCESGWSLTPAAGSKCPHNERIRHPYNCPVSPPIKFPFLDEFARSRALPFIAAANADNMQQAQICLENNAADARIIRRYEVPYELFNTKCVAVLAFLPMENAVVLTFRAINGVVQAMLNPLNMIANSLKDFEPVGGKVISNFYDMFFALWKDGLDADLRRELCEEHLNAEIWIFGHSVGGSLAALAAAWVAKSGMTSSEQIRFISFGQPRTGNLEFARHFDALLPYKYRVVHSEDTIPRRPPKLLLTDEHSLFHHRYEVWYNNDMATGAAYELCESADGIQCSGTLEPSGVKALPLGTADPLPSYIAHLSYYNVSLIAWFRSGCASKGHLKIKPKNLPG